MSVSGRNWARNFGLRPGSGFKMRPVNNSDPVIRLEYQILLKSTPITLLAGPAPVIFVQYKIRENHLGNP